MAMLELAPAGRACRLLAQEASHVEGVGQGLD